MLAAGRAVDDALWKVERPDRRVVLDRARDTDHDDAVDGDSLEHASGSLRRQLGAHAGHDGDDLTTAERSRMDGHTADLCLVQGELLDQRPKLHRHGTDE